MTGADRPWQRWVNLLRVVFGLGLVFLALANLDWGKLSGVLSAVNTGWLAAGLVSILLSLGLKVARWSWLSAFCGLKMDDMTALRAFFAGQAANIIFPLRGGEAVRAGIAWAGQKSTNPAVIISILLEKYLDLLFLFIAALISILWLPAGQAAWIKNMLALVVLSATLLLGALVLGGSRAWELLAARLPARLAQSKPAGWFRSAMQGLSQLRSARVGLGALGLTALIWISMTATNLLFFQSIGLEAGLPAALLVVVAVYIGMIPALMPGNIGPFYLAVQLALQAFPLAAEKSAGFAIILHASVTMAPLLIAGLVYLLPGRHPARSAVQ